MGNPQSNGISGRIQYDFRPPYYHFGEDQHDWNTQSPWSQKHEPEKSFSLSSSLHNRKRINMGKCIRTVIMCGPGSLPVNSIGSLLLFCRCCPNKHKYFSCVIAERRNTSNHNSYAPDSIGNHFPHQPG